MAIHADLVKIPNSNAENVKSIYTPPANAPTHRALSPRLCGYLDNKGYQTNELHVSTHPIW